MGNDNTNEIVAIFRHWHSYDKHFYIRKVAENTFVFEHEYVIVKIETADGLRCHLQATIDNGYVCVYNCDRTLQRALEHYYFHNPNPQLPPVSDFISDSEIDYSDVSDEE